MAAPELYAQARGCPGVQKKGPSSPSPRQVSLGGALVGEVLTGPCPSSSPLPRADPTLPAQQLCAALCDPGSLPGPVLIPVVKQPSSPQTEAGQ